MTKPKTKQDTPNYQTLKDELDTIMAELQRPDLDVDQTLEHYRRGLELVAQLQTYLKTAENTVRKLQTASST